MTSPNSSFNTLLSFTLQNTAKEFVDNAAIHMPLINRLKDKNNIKLDGGTEIVRPIRHTKNGTYTRISGYDAFDITPQDPFTSVQYSYKQVITTSTVSDEEKWKNSGKWKMIDLVEAKAEDVKDSLLQGLDADCYSDGTATGGKQIGGLKLLVAADPTASSSIGGINQNTYEFWRNISQTTSTDLSAVMSATVALSYMRKMKNLITRNGEGPDLALMGNDEFGYIASNLEANGRFPLDKASFVGGLESIKWLGMDIVNAESADGNLPSTYNYILNTKRLMLVIHSKRNFVALEGERTVANQAATIYPITFVGNLICTERRSQAILIDA